MTNKINVAELNKKIDSWGKSGSKWVKDGQTIGLLALEHLAACGDIGPVNRMFKAMPKGTKTSAMASWLLTHASLKANDGEDKTDKPFLFDRTKQTDVEAAKEDPWYDHKPEPTPDEVFDLQKAFKAMLHKANKAQRVDHLTPQASEAIKALAVSLGIDSTEVGGKLSVAVLEGEDALV